MDRRLEQLADLTASLEPPFAVVDLDAFDANAADLTRRTTPRASGRASIRVATKSVRSRPLIERAAAREGYAGLLAFTLPEALWLARAGTGSDGGDQTAAQDVVIGYPTTHREGLRRLAEDDEARSRITLMVDSVAHLDLVDDVVGRGHPTIKVCLDLDASLEVAGGRVHLGPWRSPTRTPDQAAALARAIVDRPGFELDGLMSYEGQIAGLGDDQDGSRVRRAAVRAMQRRSGAELADRRAEVVARCARSRRCGSSTAAAPAASSRPRPSRSSPRSAPGPASTDPASSTTTATSGRGRPPSSSSRSYVAPRRASPPPSAAGGSRRDRPGTDRLPTIARPAGLRFNPQEGAGEVQTPLLGAAAADLRLGDQVWMRHSKAGELCERVNELTWSPATRSSTSCATYRGEGHAFL